MTWTDIADSAFTDQYLVDGDYVVRGYLQETWSIEPDDTGIWTPRGVDSTVWA